MAAFSDYLEAKLIQFIFKNNAEAFATPGNNLWIALFNAATGLEANDPTAEVDDGTGYERVQVPHAGWDQTGSSVENDSDIEFPVAGASWGEVTHIAIMDSGTHGAGNVLYHGALTTARTVGEGDQFKVNAGDLTVTKD